MYKADLHMHSTCSDGVVSPEKLVEQCVQAGVSVMALTDHDTMEGTDQLQDRIRSLVVIPGVELAMAEYPGLHLLGYGYGKDTPMHQCLRHQVEARKVRIRTICANLQKVGIAL